MARGPLPPLDDQCLLVQAGLAYLIRSNELSHMNPRAAESLQNWMPTLVWLLDRLPRVATAFLDMNLMCLEALSRWHAGALHLESEQVLAIIRALHVSGKAGIPSFVALTQLRLSLHHLYDRAPAGLGHEPSRLKVLEATEWLHNERFGPGLFDGERTRSRLAREQLHARNWQLQSLDDLRLLTDLVTTPQEQDFVIAHLWQHAQQPSSLEPPARMQAAVLLCKYAALTAWTLEPTAWTQIPSQEKALDLGWACASLLSHVSAPQPMDANELFAGAAPILGSPLLESGHARKGWEQVADLLLEGVEKQAYRVENALLLTLLKAHTNMTRLGAQAANALVHLYIQRPKYRSAILELLARYDPVRAQSILNECLELDQHNQRELQVQSLQEALADKGLRYDWRNTSGGSFDGSVPEGLWVKSGTYAEEEHFQYLLEIAQVTPHAEECWRHLAFIAFHHPHFGLYATRGGSFQVAYGSQLSISCQTSSVRNTLALKLLEGHLVRHFSPQDGSAIRFEGAVLKIDPTKINAYEIKQCVEIFFGPLQILEEMDGQPEWLLRDGGTPFYQFLPSLPYARAWLNPQGVLRLLLIMESESKVHLAQLDRFFLKHFELLPADRADRLIKLTTDAQMPMAAYERHRLGQNIVTALQMAGMSKRAWNAAKTLMALYAETDLIGLPQQPTATLSPLQLQIRSLLLRAAWERLGPTGPHVESFGEAFRTMAFAAPADSAVYDYLDWVQRVVLANPSEAPRILESLPAPRTCHDILQRCELKWIGLDAQSWRSVTWSVGPYGWHDESWTPSVDGRPVRFRMPFHSAIREKFSRKLSEAEAIHLCIVNSRHLEPAEVPRVSAVVRTFFENQFCTRSLGSEFLTLNSSPVGDILEGLLPLISSLFLANAREAFAWTLDLARMVAGRYPEVASKLLDQVPFDLRDAHPEWEMARSVQGVDPGTTAATGLPAPLVKDALALADSSQTLRSSVGLSIDELGEITLVDDSASSIEYRELLLNFVEQSRQIDQPTPVKKCLQDLEATMGLLQQMQCRDPLALIRQILESEEADILRLIGDGRINCRQDLHAAPDLCGVRARWRLAADITEAEAEWIDAFVTTLLWSSEPAGMSLLHVLICHERLDIALRRKISGDVLTFWQRDAPRKAGDGGWAGLLLLLEHFGLLTDAATKRRADGLRTALLQRWHEHEGGEMPVALAMGLLSSQLAAGEPDQETLPTLETLLRKSRGQPQGDRIAIWVMRRLHDLDNKKARQIERNFRNPLIDDTRTTVEGLLSRYGIRDPRYDELNSDEQDNISRLVTLWAACANDPNDGSKAIHHLRSSFNPFALRNDSDACVIRAATFAKVGFALPGGSPDSRLLADEWTRIEIWHGLNSSMRADIAHAFLKKFAQEELAPNLEDEWEIASKLASIGSNVIGATYPQLQLTKYFTDTLNKVSRDGRYGFRHSFLLGNAVDLCEKWKTSFPDSDWYRILLPATEAAVRRAVNDVGVTEVDNHSVDPRSYLERIEKMKRDL